MTDEFSYRRIPNVNGIYVGDCPPPQIRVTHTDSGEFVDVSFGRSCRRSVDEAKRLGRCRLRGRLMQPAGPPRIVRDYDLIEDAENARRILDGALPPAL